MIAAATSAPGTTRVPAPLASDAEGFASDPGAASDAGAASDLDGASAAGAAAPPGCFDGVSAAGAGAAAGCDLVGGSAAGAASDGTFAWVDVLCWAGTGDGATTAGTDDTLVRGLVNVAELRIASSTVVARRRSVAVGDAVLVGVNWAGSYERVMLSALVSEMPLPAALAASDVIESVADTSPSCRARRAAEDAGVSWLLARGWTYLLSE